MHLSIASGSAWGEWVAVNMGEPSCFLPPQVGIWLPPNAFALAPAPFP